MSEKLTTQSDKTISSQSFWAFIVSAIIVNFTLWLATWMKALPELATMVIQMEAIVGIVLILGRKGIHLIEAVAQWKLGIPAPPKVQP